MKYFATLLTYFFVQFTFAQSTFQFSPRLKPNSTYLMNVNTITDMKYEIEGMEEGVQKIKTTSDLDLKTVSFKQDVNGNVPFELSYTKINTNTTINGNEFPFENLDELYKVKFKGIDRSSGRELTEFVGLDQNKKIFEMLFNSFKNLTVYPSQTFRIGDTHSITNTFDFPMPNGTNFSFNYNMAFTLNKIENGKAYFYVQMTAANEDKALEMFVISIKKYDVKGNFWVDINDNNITEMQLNGPFVLEVNGSGISITTTNNSKYAIKSSKL